MTAKNVRDHLAKACGFPSILESEEQKRREERRDIEWLGDDKYEAPNPFEDRGDLRDEGRNPDGTGLSYAERNT